MRQSFVKLGLALAVAAGGLAASGLSIAAPPPALADAVPVKEEAQSPRPFEHVNISAGHHMRLQKIADTQDVTVGWVVNQAVETYLQIIETYMAQKTDNPEARKAQSKEQHWQTKRHVQKCIETVCEQVYPMIPSSLSGLDTEDPYGFLNGSLKKDFLDMKKNIDNFNYKENYVDYYIHDLDNDGASDYIVNFNNSFCSDIGCGSFILFPKKLERSIHKGKDYSVIRGQPIGEIFVAWQCKKADPKETFLATVRRGLSVKMESYSKGGLKSSTSVPCN